MHKTDTSVLHPVISHEAEGSHILPHLCDSDVISMKLERHKKYLTGSMPLFTSTTVSTHVVVLRLSPLPQCGEKLAPEGRNATS